VISAPGGDDVDATIVYGVNHGVLKASHTVISNASCTTNCLVPLVKVLNDGIGVVAGVMTTIHSYTNDQVLTDVYHSDLRRARSATHSMIPTKTGAAASVGLVMPELKGKLDGFSIRVPTINVSLVDLSFTARRATSVAEINALMKAAAASGPLQGILAYTEAPLVSVDYNHDPHSSVYDATMTKVIEGTRQTRPDPRGSQCAGAEGSGDERCAHSSRLADGAAGAEQGRARDAAVPPGAAGRG
jgi:glyceraldehyde 3-phosphate dehydrogenase